MAIVTPTKTLVQGSAAAYAGGGSTLDNEIILELDTLGYDEIVFGATAGAVDVFGSLDGTNFLADALALEDLTATAPATRVVVSAAGKSYLIRGGRYAKLRFRQNGDPDVVNFAATLR